MVRDAGGFGIEIVKQRKAVLEAVRKYIESNPNDMTNFKSTFNAPLVMSFGENLQLAKQELSANHLPEALSHIVMADILLGTFMKDDITARLEPYLPYLFDK